MKSTVFLVITLVAVTIILHAQSGQTRPLQQACPKDGECSNWKTTTTRAPKIVIVRAKPRRSRYGRRRGVDKIILQDGEVTKYKQEDYLVFFAYWLATVAMLIGWFFAIRAFFKIRRVYLRWRARQARRPADDADQYEDVHNRPPPERPPQKEWKYTIYGLK